MDRHGGGRSRFLKSHGGALVPFLLNRLFQLSDGRALQTRIAHIRNSCGLAAAAASALRGNAESPGFHPAEA